MRPNDETNSTKEEKKNSYLRSAFSIVMILVGALAVALTQDSTGRGPVIIQQMGLAFMIAGVASLFSEFVIERWKPDQSLVLLEMIRRFQGSGMRMVCFPRKGYWRYHTWFLVNDPQEAFFAGRSVLHRIQADFKIRNLPSVEDSFIRKLQEGSKIRILFCDPTWELVPQLALAESQSEKKLLSDLATSLSIVYKLWENLHGQNLKGEIEIRVYRELVQYAYHYTRNLQTNDSDMLVGFYFAQKLGCRSPLFEVVDESIQTEFKDHFANVFARAMVLLEYPSFGQGKRLDEQFMLQCKGYLLKQLGEDTVRSLME
jgi:hypothetical protein